VLKALDKPEPPMPPFDPANHELIPQEEDIILFIDKLEAKKAAEAENEVENDDL